MAGAEAEIEVTSDLSHEQLRKELCAIYVQFNKQSLQLAGLKGLVRQLSEKREEAARLESKCERLETHLARAENRVAQLNLATSNGNAASSQGAIVVPGVSRKVLESLVKDNTRLRTTLQHMTKKGVGGVDMAVENCELHEIILALRTERDAKLQEVDELKRGMASMSSKEGNALKDQIVSLSEQLATTQRNLESKQAFCEKIVTENEGLKEKLSSLGEVAERITDVGNLKVAIGKVASSQPEMRGLMNRVWDGTDDDDEMTQDDRRENAEQERDRLREELIQSRKAVEENVAQTRRLNEEIAELQERNREIRDRQEHATQKLTAELEYVKRERDFAREELIKSTENGDNLKREIERITGEHGVLEAKIVELTNERSLMQSALESYEKDFKKEHEEKRKIELGAQKMQQEVDRIAREYGQLQRRYLGLTQRIRDSHSVPSYWSVGRGGNDDVVDAPETTRPDIRSNELQCPTCERIFHCGLLEDHMRDCEGLQ